MISVFSLVHACVAIVAALAGEIAAICWHIGYLATRGLIYYVSSSLTYYAHECNSRQ